MATFGMCDGRPVCQAAMWFDVTPLPLLLIHPSPLLFLIPPPQGRGSGFPGRRRSRGGGVGGGRGARGRSRLKTQESLTVSPGVRAHTQPSVLLLSGPRYRADQQPISLQHETLICLSVCQSVYIEPFQPKEEEENSMHNTVVMFSTSDHFTLKQVHDADRQTPGHGPAPGSRPRTLLLGPVQKAGLQTWLLW